MNVCKTMMWGTVSVTIWPFKSVFLSLKTKSSALQHISLRLAIEPATCCKFSEVWIASSILSTAIECPALSLKAFAIAFRWIWSITVCKPKYRRSSATRAVPERSYKIQPDKWGHTVINIAAFFTLFSRNFSTFLSFSTDWLVSSTCGSTAGVESFIVASFSTDWLFSSTCGSTTGAESLILGHRLLKFSIEIKIDIARDKHVTPGVVPFREFLARPCRILHKPPRVLSVCHIYDTVRPSLYSCACALRARGLVLDCKGKF